MGLISMNMEEKILQIPIEDIIPNRFQPRLTFDDAALQELASSIKEHGIIQPLVLRKLGDKYEIIAGERRYKASQLAGLTTVPAVISDIDDEKSAEVALVENIQRKNLTAIEEAKSYKNILDRGYLTQEQLAEKLGISQGTIANKLRLLNLCDEVQDALLQEKISERHARALLAVKDPAEQIKWLNKILNDRLTVRQLDIELKKVLNNSDDDDSSIPIVNLTPNIDDIKENALDINPTQGLHDIESMLKPSVANEKTFDLSNPVDNVETLDIDDDIDTTSNVDNSNKETDKPQNKFFNFLEDEVANMHEEASIDDLLNRPRTNNNDNSNNIENLLNNNSDNSNSNDIIDSIKNDNEIVQTNNSVLDNDIVKIEPLEENDNNIIEEIQPEKDINDSEIINNIEDTKKNNDSVNTFFNFENSSSDNNIIETVNNNIERVEETINNNIIEVVEETSKNEVFDPMSMVDTLEPDYEEKKEEEKGIDLKTAITKIRDTKETLEALGFNINIEEADLGDSYNITINIIK